EKERLAFVPAAYWDLAAALAKDGARFEATLTHLGGVRIAQGRDYDPDTGKLKESAAQGDAVVPLDETTAKALVDRARDARWAVDAVEERETTRSPAPAFTTSTLQQESSRKLGLAAKDTMRIAQ